MERLSRERRRSFQARLVQMPNPVHLLVFTRRDGRREIAARQLGRELRALSRDVHLELHDVDANPLLAARYGIDETPAFALLTGGVIIADTRIRFSGLPEGPLLEALVAGIVAVSQAASVVAPATDGRVPSLDRPVHLEVYVPRPADADSQLLLRLQRLALLNARLSLDVKCGHAGPAWARHPDEGDALVTVMNDTAALRVGQDERQLLEALEAASYGEPERLDLQSRDRVPLAGERRTGQPAVGGAAAVVTYR